MEITINNLVKLTIDGDKINIDTLGRATTFNGEAKLYHTELSTKEVLDILETPRHSATAIEDAKLNLICKAIQRNTEDFFADPSSGYALVIKGDIGRLIVESGFNAFELRMRPDCYVISLSYRDTRCSRRKVGIGIHNRSMNTKGWTSIIESDKDPKYEVLNNKLARVENGSIIIPFK